MNCEGRPSMQVVTQFDDKTFDTLYTAGSDYWKTLYNTWEFYNPTALPTPDLIPYYPEYKQLRKSWNAPELRRLYLRWYEKKHQTQAAKAVIAIHGGSAIPDSWFADSQVSQSWGSNYLNFGGTNLFNDGYDVFAPSVNWHPRFLTAQTRLAQANGDIPLTLDLERIIALFEYLVSLGYERIDITGISYGAQLAVHAAQRLRDHPQRGAVVAIEGWLPETAYLTVPNSFALHAWNWENMFGNGQSDAVFRDLPSKTYLAFGSCSVTAPTYPGIGNVYTAPYATLPQDRVIYFIGAHEYQHSVFNEAVSRSGL